MQGVPSKIVKVKFNWPEQRNRIVLAILLLITKKFEVEEASFGSKPRLASIGFNIIPPPIPTVGDINPVRKALKIIE